MSKPIEKVAIVGASGRFGSNIVEEILKVGKHQVTALARKDSDKPLPEGLNVVKVDYSDHDALVSALKGHQFLIITLTGTVPLEVHIDIIKAGVAAGIPWIMPNVYGFDYTNAKLMDPEKGEMYHAGAAKIVAAMEEIGATYIILCCGFWYEWSLAAGLEWYGFDIKNKKIEFIDDGNTRTNASAWETCGKAVANLLSLPEKDLEQWKNKPLRISSFHVSQRDMLDSVHRVLGTTDKDWDISYQPAEERVADGMKQFAAGDRKGFAKSMYTRIFYKDGVGSYESEGLANDALGLPKDDIDEAARKVVKLVDSDKSPYAFTSADLKGL